MFPENMSSRGNPTNSGASNSNSNEEAGINANSNINPGFWAGSSLNVNDIVGVNGINGKMILSVVPLASENNAMTVSVNAGQSNNSTGEMLFDQEYELNGERKRRRQVPERKSVDVNANSMQNVKGMQYVNVPQKVPT